MIVNIVVLHLTDLISTAEKLNLTQFIDAVTSIGLEGMLQRGNFTAFVPLNEAFESIIPKEVVSIMVPKEIRECYLPL